MLTTILFAAATTAIPALTQPQPNTERSSNLTIIQVDAPGWDGEFRVWATTASETGVFTLSGTMSSDAGAGKDFDALITLTLPITHHEAREHDGHRIVTSRDHDSAHRVEPLGPDTAVWTDHKRRSRGSITVYQARASQLRLSDAQTAAIFNALLGSARRNGAPDPDFSKCRTSATELCGENGVASFLYAYDATENSVTCHFTSREPTIGE